MQQQFVVRPAAPGYAQTAVPTVAVGQGPQVGMPRPQIILQQPGIRPGGGQMIQGSPLTASAVIQGGPLLASGVMQGSLSSPPGVNIQQPGVRMPMPGMSPQTSVASANVPSVPKVELARARIKRETENPDDRIKAYKAFLDLLHETGALDRLPTDAEGRLRVGAPFCHDFFDAPYLVPFLVEKCLQPAGNAHKMYVFGADLYPQHTWWAAWKEWMEAEYEGKVTSYFSQGDLSTNCLPPSDLIIGVHPEVTHGGNWPVIIRNTIQSRSERGVIAFATFYRHEADEMVKICEAWGVTPEVHENPFHVGKEDNATGTFLRFLILIK